MIMIKNENGKDVIINNRCTASKTLTLALMLPRRMSAIVANRMKIDQITRCALFGFLEPLSVNMLNTNTAESTEVIKKLINKNTEVMFKTVAKG